MHLFHRLEHAHSRWNVLEHSFYLRWSRGELTAGELACYAGEYGHAVAALADCLAGAAEAAEPALRPALAQHAAEERAHVALWERFAAAAGGDPARKPRPETRACVEAWTAGHDLLERLVVAYAIESGQPAISRTKLQGLLERYGFEEGPATEYFRLHATLDQQHAGSCRALIAERLAGADPERLLELSEGALRGNWTLLDGVERAAGRAGSPPPRAAVAG
jgi:pyrroloquinoline-quinone synthase